MIEIKGKGCTSVKVIKHSIANNVELFTFELEYPRFILAELNTHRMLSKNSASSRAIPVSKMLETIMEKPASPIYWGKNQPGMQASEELEGDDLTAAKSLWENAASSAVTSAMLMNKINVHKQASNRITEPFQVMKTIVTGTEWDNFFRLRDHPAAQPEFRDLAHTINLAYHQSAPDVLKAGEWHLPYIATRRNDNGEFEYWVDEHTQVDLDTARMVSVSCCAQVSYRKLDDSIEKARSIFERLNLRGENGQPAHSSPTEHQATPMSVDTLNNRFNAGMWEAGTTHVNRDGYLWSGNLKRWVQYRQLL